ncbi:DUF3089 domain-containing protein [Sphingomonas sp. 1P06PA]|uniref:DUF3089 domain-containing protein n=1 Tax=Sphingomonas sp. 1P06PA TaxID=554121 RepID=UPI0039A71AAA
MLTLAAAIGWNLFQDQIIRATFVPSGAFAQPADATAPDYARPAAWLSRPDLPDDPSRYTPPGFTVAARPEVAVFYVAPTTYIRKDRWNGPLDDTESNARLRLFASSQASAFNGMGAIWAPRYRQASIGAFLTSEASAQKAIDFAYGDVERAFAAFLKQIPASRPILLAGHSQGALHLTRLLHERIAGTPLTKRIVAAYIVGWPVSIEADLPALGLGACDGPASTGCILSWQSFAEPAEPRQILDAYNASTGFTGQPRRDTRMLCVNPLTGAPDTAALATANLGALVPRPGLNGADLEPGRVPARCAPNGLLLIGGEPKGYGSYVLPGRNYHVFDYALFWANIRADAERRAKEFAGR